MSYFDPFEAKLERRNHATIQVTAKFFNNAIPAFNTISLSKLTKFTIQTQITLSQHQIMHILNLDSSEPLHNEVYASLINVVRKTARYLYVNTKLSTLREFPMTNVEFVSFEIARKFPELFYVPVEKSGGEFRLSYKCRFTEMWIITYLLKQEYSKVVDILYSDL
ncbi:uncharacterized protein SPAPADRAFT_137569 [Spathaspora passalidarum NRRL Y-27907]|uniref:Uncharacterized protein n=1 Tax=Spathaspora passalidarum (strain NRRL Y-27907 / 11-Y1) TaxID=619300 RepID=G3AMC9_SPAPN|nr:uncharacterized protein SPAPADRAFT_137569 [Spathaspora passalidarum NRRL Y-27907]EGW32781.1 hypothetical protein SPAPADRAFT_137569 [Spathaspora passalidarum NRRL Y-27907]